MTRSRASTGADKPAPASNQPSNDGSPLMHQSSIVEGQDAIEWGVNDVFVIPPWKRYHHEPAEEAVLFSISDRPAQEALGIWREGH